MHKTMKNGTKKVRVRKKCDISLGQKAFGPSVHTVVSFSLAEITTAGKSCPFPLSDCSSNTKTFMWKKIGVKTGTKKSVGITLVLKHVIINYTRSNSSHSRAKKGAWGRYFKPNNPLFTCAWAARQASKDLLPVAFFPSFPVPLVCHCLTDAFFSAAAGWQLRRETGTWGDFYTAPGNRLSSDTPPVVRMEKKAGEFPLKAPLWTKQIK